MSLELVWVTLFLAFGSFFMWCIDQNSLNTRGNESARDLWSSLYTAWSSILTSLWILTLITLGAQSQVWKPGGFHSASSLLCVTWWIQSSKLCSIWRAIQQWMPGSESGHTMFLISGSFLTSSANVSRVCKMLIMMCEPLVASHCLVNTDPHPPKKIP